MSQSGDPDSHGAIDNTASPVRVSIVHATRDRIRLRAPDLVDDTEGMTALAEALAETPNLVRIVGRPPTGTLILYFDGDAEDLARDLFASGKITLAARAPGPVPVSMVARFGLARLDKMVRDSTGGALDAKTAFAVVLFGAAVMQASQGRLFGPTTTLMMGLLTLLKDDDKG